MANNNLPAHDFAPAWLKIPSYDAQKPSGAESNFLNNASRRDEPCSIRRFDRDEPRHHYSLDSRRDRDATSGDRKSLFFPSRHQSIDIDDGQYSSSIFRPVTHLSSSQPSLLRRTNCRPDFRYPSSKFNAVELNSNIYGGGKGKPGRKTNGSIEGNEIDVGSNNFNQEFPSLKGDDEHSLPCSVNGGAWENPRNAKVHGGINQKIHVIQRPLKTDLGIDGRSKSPINNNSKCASAIGQVIKPNSQCPVYRPLIPAKRQTPPLNPPAPQTMEILVKNPKTRSNKSEFLKTLRSEAKGGEESEAKKFEQAGSAHAEENGKTEVPECERNGDHCNGMDISKLSVRDANDDANMLSSSLEAEQRLLKEMGWKEDGSDDDFYAPLTEDELREFRDSSQKLLAEKRNGIQRSLQTNWSPKRTLPFANNVVLPPETWSSSSDTDSD